MAFNPLKNRTQVNLNTNKEFKEEPKVELNNQINHKSNVYKILKTNDKLTNEDAINLTTLIDKYFSKYV